MQLWFDLAYFLKIAATAFDDTYLVTLQQLKSKDWQLSLQCLDASAPMSRSVQQDMARIYFSATLSPMVFYVPQLSLPEDDVEQLALRSPFPEKNRLVLVSDACSIRFKDREQTLPDVAAMILAAVSKRRGNYLVFAPSFHYLNRLRATIAPLQTDASVELMFQKPGMPQADREAFLDRFNRYGEQTLIAFSVLGSLFNEGVDLAGERLIGVIVIGTGLPGLSPERSLMGEYFQHRLGDGFRFAYVYPGFNRVMQAAGRLIRNETDTGFILLIDDRYTRDDYRQLLPEEWNTHVAGDAADVADYISEFWDEIG